MTEPQKEYIITEAQIIALETLLRHKLSDLRSRPYTSAEQVLEPSYDELVKFALWAQERQGIALRIMQEHGFVLDNLKEPMQKLAFTFYTDLCEIEMKARHLFEAELQAERERK